MTLFSECTGQKVGSGTCLKAQERGLELGGIGYQLRTRKLLAHWNFAVFSQCNQVKGGVAQSGESR